MNTHRAHRRTAGELGTIWYVIPLVWIFAAVIVSFALSAQPQLFAEEVLAPANAIPPAPYVSGDPSLPSASLVFKDGASYEAAQHVDTF